MLIRRGSLRTHCSPNSATSAQACCVQFERSALVWLFFLLFDSLEACIERLRSLSKSHSALVASSFTPHLRAFLGCCRHGGPTAELGSCEIEISSEALGSKRAWRFLLFLLGPLDWPPILNWWATRHVSQRTPGICLLSISGSSTWESKDISTTHSRRLFGLFNPHTIEVCSSNAKLQGDILLSLSLKLCVQVRIYRDVLPWLFCDSFGDFINDFGGVEANFVAIENFLITERTRILQSEDVLQAGLVHVVVAIFELQACLPVHYFSLAEGTVGLGNVEIALRRLKSLLEAHGEESWE